MKLQYICFIGFWILSRAAGAQEKSGELTISARQELPDSLGLETQAVLVIISEVPGLQFESNMQYIKAERRGSNEWQLVLEPDKHILTFRAPGCLPANTESMDYKAKHTYRMTVSRANPLPGALLIKTKPDSASVHIDGAPIDAKTPCRLDEMSPGRYYVQVIKEGHRPAARFLVVESNAVTSWEIELTQTAVRVRIDLENDSLDARIFIDGEAKGRTPGDVYLQPGIYKLMLTKDSYKTFEKVIEIPPDSANVRILAKLESAKKPLLKKGFFHDLSSIITFSAGFVATVAAIVFFLSG
jgi:hypothetical protein